MRRPAGIAGGSSSVATPMLVRQFAAAKISSAGEILPDAPAIGAHAEEHRDHLVHCQRFDPPFVEAPG